MEDLVKHQDEAGRTIQQIISNAKKAPLNRRTFEFYNKTISELDEQWTMFNKRDNILRRNHGNESEHAYFTKDFYGKMAEKFTEMRDDLCMKRDELMKPMEQSSNDVQLPSTSKATNDETGAKAKISQDIPQPTARILQDNPQPTISNKLTKQRKFMQMVQQIVIEVLSDQEPRSTQFYAMKLRTIEQHWKSIQMLHDSLWTSVDNYDFDHYFEMETLVNETIITLQERIPEQVVPQRNEPITHSSSPLKLPNIELPKFDGTYIKWRQFRDLFMELVDKQSISDCQKIWYLKSSLSGEAGLLIQHLTATAANYTEAWKIIEERYENPRLLVNAVLKRLLAQTMNMLESASAIKGLHDTTQECLLSLQNLGLDTNNWDPIVLHLLIQRLGRTTLALWEQSLPDPKKIPTLKEFLSFLRQRFQSLEASGARNQSSTNEFSKSNGPYKSLSVVTSSSKQCVVCKGEHPIYKCQTFENMAVKQRLATIQRANHCVNCLRYGHKANNCTSGTCLKCKKKHNTLEHLEKVEASYNRPAQPSVQPVALSSTGLSPSHTTSVMLTTVLISVTDHRGGKIQCRAILDKGSQANFITKEMMLKLGLHGASCEVDIEGIGRSRKSVAERVNIEISSLNTGFTSHIEAYVIPKIVAHQPSKTINTEHWNIPNNIKLADASFNNSGPVDLLIGAGTFYSILYMGQISLGDQMPILQNSLLGWLVGGTYGDETNSITCGVSIEDITLNNQLEKFWQLESNEPKTNALTPSEKRIETFFTQNLRRAKDGRYIVRLPYEIDARKLGESRDIALHRFKCMERRLMKDETLRTEYIKFMREYESLGHMKEVTNIDFNQPHYFVPHHAVLKPESTTTKLRVVFDASAKTSTNISLNDILAKGPIVQDDVFTILTRFRFPRYVFTADIEKMYRQIWVDDQDQPMQLIWWREDPEKSLKCYQLKTVTYGTTSAPYLAIRTLQALAEEKKSQFPLASSAINSNFYVDDVLAGSDNLLIASRTQQQLCTLLQSAGLHLRKWCANHPQLLENIPKVDQEMELTFNESSPADIKTMGLIWNPARDDFKLKIGKFNNGRITKRNILSDSAHIYDPLGFVGPVTVKAKIMLQKLWLLKLDWDAAIPQDMDSTWSQFREELQLLQHMRIPRHVFGHKSSVRPQIHIFADASEAAYGAVAYMRIKEPPNGVIIRFLCAKSRVAPVKQITLARLELCAAKLAAEMFQKLQESNCFKDVEPYFWSDSTVTLGWIYAESRNYHMFIANRIATIQRLTTQQQWRYVLSQDNPADLLSRGLMPSKIVENNFWMYGPKFIHGSVSCWPLQPPRGVCSLEMRKPILTTATTTSTVADDILQRINHKNNFRCCQRIIAYILRVKSFKRKRAIDANIQDDEAEDALKVIVKLMQKSAFAEEIGEIKRYGTVNNFRSISSLTPFLDEYGILRVGGRLESAEIKFDSKHPMLLPNQHQLTKLLLEAIHKENLHAGPQTLMSIVRQRFCPLKLKMAARSVVQHCVECTRAKSKLLQQLMGNLPADRVQPSRPFINSGVDFFGPVWIHYKIRGKRPTKAYVALFCCFATKAIHMELVSDLTTDAFIGSVKRFIARRGRCKRLYCDNATNFVGARNRLAELQHIIQDSMAKEKIINECNKKGLEFSFIPPRAPHFGGLWEAGVNQQRVLYKLY